MNIERGWDKARFVAARCRSCGASTLSAIILCCVASPVVAQDYYFAVPEMAMEVHIRKDSSIHIAYDITFENKGKAIDVVDIGAPNKSYRWRSATASIDGNELRNIRRSQYVGARRGR